MHLRSLLTYSHANRAVLKLRDQKQLDFEALSEYLSSVTSERDRLAAVISGHAGSTGLGIGAYLRDRVDAIRGADDDRHRVEKMRKLDIKIKEVSRDVFPPELFGDFLFLTSFKMLSLQHMKHLMPSVMKLYENKPSSNFPKKPK